MSDNSPDFDNMTPEEIMSWMETLAKRQGASEGFTTAADMDIAEVDPSTVVIDEPGYVPYGEEMTQPIKPAVQTQASPMAQPQTPPPSARPAAPPQPIQQPPPLPQRPAAQVYAPPPAQAAPPPLPQAEPEIEIGGLAWLESLAADQSEELFNLDLSDISEAPPIQAAPAEATNPISWLEDLARSQVAEPSVEEIGASISPTTPENPDPYAEGVNPMEWLETLARRQGAKDEELITPASMNIPTPAEAEVENDDYEPFSFDTVPTRRPTEPADLENPADWLSSLAGAEGYSEEGVLATQMPQIDDQPPTEDMSMGAIQDAIASGTVTSEQMQYFLDQQAEELAAHPEALEFGDDVDDNDDDYLEPAQLPDWLTDLMPQPSMPEPTKPIDALFEAPPQAEAMPEMPDWLRQDVLSEQDSDDLDNIFAPDEEDSLPIAGIIAGAELAYEIEVDSNDPWVEAFDAEYEQDSADADAVPEWYEQNVNDPSRIAAVEGQPIAEETSLLQNAALPEEKGLPVGQPQAIPDWAVSESPVPETALLSMLGEVEEEQAAVADDMPDWLREVEASVSPEEVPAWLVETLSQPEEAAPEVIMVAEPEPEPEMYVPVPEVVAEGAPPQPIPVAAAAPPPPKPAPAPISGDAAAVRQQARDREQSGDLEGALSHYESLIRGSLDLEGVVADLSELVKSYKTTPAVYRVLGDGLMRQGKLQAALNTYREALNQL